MSRLGRGKRAAYPPSRRVVESLAETQDRITIATMLAQGATVTPIGDKTYLRLSSGGFGTFDSRLVEQVMSERIARLREEGAL